MSTTSLQRKDTSNLDDEVGDVDTVDAKVAGRHKRPRYSPPNRPRTLITPIVRRAKKKKKKKNNHPRLHMLTTLAAPPCHVRYLY